MFEKILYPTDFSDVSLHALEHCIPEIIKRGIEEIHLLHVIDITVAEFEAFELEEVYREKLEKLARKLEKRGADVKPVVTIGLPSVEIAEIAEKEGVDLIVIPSAGENVWRRMFLGSTASNLARTTQRPILLLKYGKEGDKIEPPTDCGRIFSRPLIALDFSKCSVKIIKTVKEFRKDVDSAILLHSIDYGKIEELEHNISVAKKNLEKTAKGLGVKAEKEVLVGSASQAIIGMALSKGATLIVIGKKGRSFIRDLILGSTAERVIRDSKVPVLLVPCD